MDAAIWDQSIFWHDVFYGMIPPGLVLLLLWEKWIEIALFIFYFPDIIYIQSWSLTKASWILRKLMPTGKINNYVSNSKISGRDGHSIHLFGTYSLKITFYVLLLFFHCWVVSESVTPWTAARQASLSIANSRSLIKVTSIELVMLSNHLILCHPLLLPPSVFPSIRVFSNESVLRITWPKY